MTNCVWSFICVCNNNCKCEKYLDVNSEAGGKILAAYTKDVNKAIEPVNENWKEIFRLFKED